MPSARSDTKGIDVDTPEGNEDEPAGDEDDSELDDERSRGESGHGDEPAGEEGEAADEEDVEDVEAEEAVPERRAKPSKPKPAARKPSGEPPEREPGKGKMMWAVVLVLLIVVPAAGLVYFFFGPSGEIKDITLIAQEKTDATTSVPSLSLVAQIDTGKPSHLSGNADLTILYKGATTYSGKIGISESQGSKTIPLSQFAEGNGDYKVQIQFQGKGSSTTFTESHIIEKVNVTAYNMTRQTNSTIDYGSARLGVRVIFLSLSNESQKAIPGDRLDIEVTGAGGTNKYTESIADKMQLNVNYSIPGNGNYTVKATFSNSKVRAGSALSTLTANGLDAKTNQPYVMVYIPPKANAGPDQTIQWKLADGGGKVTLDGSGSIGYGGANIDIWTWDLGNDYIADGKTVTYTYVTRNTYTVTLLVYDQNGNTDTDTCIISVV